MNVVESAGKQEFVTKACGSGQDGMMCRVVKVKATKDIIVPISVFPRIARCLGLLSRTLHTD